MARSKYGKSITVSADAEGMKQARDFLNNYRQKMLRRASSLLDKMLKEGENYAFLGAAGHIYTGITADTIMSMREGDHGMLLVGGNAIWVEFGTGVVANNYNPYPHHKAQELGMNAIGTFVSPYPFNKSGKPHGNNPNGWWYMGDDGEYHHTYGIPSDPFFYNTAQMLRREYDKMAKEIFKKP